ncbi:hypothetical protein BN3658_00581 [Coriobacteriaceae bacterium CHKCI002]|nr:hypothetical protein BN3658_00581 [Coriobacteriaceae bacterium CHKCI002]
MSYAKMATMSTHTLVSHNASGERSGMPAPPMTSPMQNRGTTHTHNVSAAVPRAPKADPSRAKRPIDPLQNITVKTASASNSTM